MTDTGQQPERVEVTQAWLDRATQIEASADLLYSAARDALRRARERSKRFYLANMIEVENAMEEVALALNAPEPPIRRLTFFWDGWRCYHCGETFTDERCARLHFGRDEDSKAACVIKAGAEGSLLRALRQAEEQADNAMQAIHAECTDAANAYHAAVARHSQALIAAEEAGYERGLSDGRASVGATAAGRAGLEGAIVGLRQVSANLRGRSDRDVAVASEQHGFDLEAMSQYADHVEQHIAVLAAAPTSPVLVDDWQKNVEVLLDGCPLTIRSYEGGGPENLVQSLVLTFAKMQALIAAKYETSAQATPAPDVERRLERDIETMLLAHRRDGYWQDEEQEVLDAWRARRGDLGKTEWRWWWRLEDDENYRCDAYTRDDALSEARREEPAQSIHLIEARLWNDDMEDGDDVQSFAETRNHEVVAALSQEPWT